MFTIIEFDVDALNIPSIGSMLISAGHHVWVRIDAALLRLGESAGSAQDEEHPVQGPLQSTGGPPNLVLGHHIPLLRTYQLRRGCSVSDVHGLPHSMRCPYGGLPLFLCPHGESFLSRPQ